jgi:hypothetical protein
MNDNKMNASDNSINRWEELLYGIFTHSSLGFHSDLCIDEDEDGQMIENFGWIYPGKEVMEETQSTLRDWRMPAWTDIIREFEKEISMRLAPLGAFDEKLQYISYLKIRFSEPLSRIGAYEKMLGKITDAALKDEPYDFDDIVRINEFLRLLRGVEKILRSVDDQISGAIVETGSTKKLKWTCNTKIAGFVIKELISNGYIEAPMRRGELNIHETAKVCMGIFDFETKSQANLEREISESTNTLEEFRRKKIKLPKPGSL